MVDDEGLYKKDNGAFMIGSYPQPLSGNGLLVGCDPAGENDHVKTSLAQIQSMVRFVHVDVLPEPKIEIHEVKNLEDFLKRNK